MMKTLVLALGNPLRGDDGVGTAVLQALSHASLPPHVTLLDGGTPGLETALLWQGYARVIIIDAAEMGAAPGTWRRFTPDEVQLSADAVQASLHQAGLAQALTLAQALHIMPEELIIFGVQPAALDWSPGLSGAVAATIPALCTAVRREWQIPVPSTA